MVAGPNTSRTILYNLGSESLHSTPAIDEVYAAPLLGTVELPAVAGKSKLLVPMYVFISIVPAGGCKKGVGSILDSGIEVTKENLWELGRILRCLGYYHLGLLSLCCGGNMVQVSIQNAEYVAGPTVAQAHPVAMAGAG